MALDVMHVVRVVHVVHNFLRERGFSLKVLHLLDNFVLVSTVP